MFGFYRAEGASIGYDDALSDEEAAALDRERAQIQW